MTRVITVVIDAYWLKQRLVDHGAFIRETPMLLPVSLPRIVALDCGRAHLLALDAGATVFELFAWGLAARVHDSTGRWGAAASPRVRSISAGWSCSSLLI